MELVYVIGSEERGAPFKIGKSNALSLKNRIKSLQTGNPLTLKSFYEFTPKDGDGYSLENKIRNQLINNFGYKKLKGEWIDTDNKKPIEQVGEDISNILKEADYDYENDPAYNLLKKENNKLNDKLKDRYDDLLVQHNLIFDQLKSYDSLNQEIKDLHKKQKKLINKISKYKKTDLNNEISTYQLESLLNEEMSYSRVDVNINAMQWFLLIYKMITQQASPKIHHRQGYDILRLPKNGCLYVTYDNQRYTYDIEKNYLSFERPVQREDASMITGGITGKHYIDKADMYRYYEGNRTYHDKINLRVDKDFEKTTLKSCQINYNDKTYNFINEDFLKEGHKQTESKSMESSANALLF
tara:strand:- start:6 stop:1070 length:1065 start_codon:yes stop_codon:yes gene_type:complete